MKNKIKAVAFLRVSSARQRDNTSHETQEQEMLKYAKENALEVVQIFRLTESAKNSAERIQYRAGLNWAIKNRVRQVLFYIFDRETRNLTDNEENENLIRSGDLVLHYVKERKIYHAESSDSDFFLRDIQAVTNKQYIRAHRTKVIDAMRTKAEAGHYPGNHPPLGYVTAKAPSGKGTVIVRDPNTKNVRQVQREFELRAENYSCDQIREVIIQEGFISPLKIANYHRSGIEKRLRNCFYYGQFVWQDKAYDGKHELIIDQLTLDKVKKSFRLGSYQRKPSGDHGSLAGGFLKCGNAQCGCNIVYDPKTKAIVKTGETKTFHYYRCTNGRKVHSRHQYAKESDLFAQFESALDAIWIDDVLAAEISSRINECFSKVRRERKAEINRYRGLLADLEAREDEAYADRKSGVLDENMYARQIGKVRDERRRYTDLLEAASEDLDAEALETAQSTVELAKEAKSLWNSAGLEKRVQLLKMLLSNQWLNGVSVGYELRKPWAILKEMKESKDWWPLGYQFLTACRLKAA